MESRCVKFSICSMQDLITTWPEHSEVLSDFLKYFPKMYFKSQVSKNWLIFKFKLNIGQKVTKD